MGLSFIVELISFVANGNTFAVLFFEMIPANTLMSIEGAVGRTLGFVSISMITSRDF